MCAIKRNQREQRGSVGSSVSASLRTVHFFIAVPPHASSKTMPTFANPDLKRGEFQRKSRAGSLKSNVTELCQETSGAAVTPRCRTPTSDGTHIQRS